MGESDDPKVAILVLNWNGADLLEDCLASIEQNTSYPNVRTIVVDNDSSDGSVEMVESKFSGVEVIQHDDNLGWAEGNNEAIRQVSADYYLILNNDTRVRSGWIEELVRCAQEYDSVGVVSPKLVYPDDTPQFLGDKVLLSESGIPEPVMEGIRNVEYRYGSEREVVTAVGAAMLVDDEVFETVGLFDQEYPHYMEESDFCIRTRTAGFRIVYTPESVVVHDSRSTSETDPYYEFYLRRIARVRFYVLNFTLLRLLMQVPLEAVTVLDAIRREYLRWLLKAYWESGKQLPGWFRQRRERTQVSHTTNKIRRALSKLSPK